MLLFSYNKLVSNSPGTKKQKKDQITLLSLACILTQFETIICSKQDYRAFFFLESICITSARPQDLAGSSQEQNKTTATSTKRNKETDSLNLTIESFRFENEDEDKDENEDQGQLLLTVCMLKSVTVMAWWCCCNQLRRPGLVEVWRFRCGENRVLRPRPCLCPRI